MRCSTVRRNHLRNYLRRCVGLIGMAGILTLSASLTTAAANDNGFNDSDRTIQDHTGCKRR